MSVSGSRVVNIKKRLGFDMKEAERGDAHSVMLHLKMEGTVQCASRDCTNN